MHLNKVISTAAAPNRLPPLVHGPAPSVLSWNLLYFLCHHKYRARCVKLPGRWTGMFPRFRLSPEREITSCGCSVLRLYSWGLICSLASQPSKSSYPVRAEKRSKEEEEMKKVGNMSFDGRGLCELTWSFLHFSPSTAT